MYRTLIDAETLRRHLGEDGWRIFDCRAAASDRERGERVYREAHIPGARHADLDRVLAASPTALSGRHPLPDPDRLAAWLGEEGVDARTQIVAYDDVGGACAAARLWWLARWLGHQAVAVLDGGLPAWSEAGGRLDAGYAPRPQARHFDIRSPLAKFLDAAAVLRIVRGESAGVLVDARGAARFRGESEPLDSVAGHIPGALNRPYAENLGPDGRFLSPEKLRQRFGFAAAPAPSAVVHYCGSGVTAAHNALAMEHVGLAGSRLYVGSWSEWVSDRTRPVARDD